MFKEILIITFIIICIVLLLVFIYSKQKYYCYDTSKNSCVISKSCDDKRMSEYECNDKYQKFCYGEEVGICSATVDCKYNLRKEECENVTKQRQQLKPIVFDANKNVTVTSGNVTQWEDIDSKYKFSNTAISTSKLLTYGNNSDLKNQICLNYLKLYNSNKKD
jgi:hypothetical protein